MGVLIQETLELIMQMSAEDLSLGKDPFDSISVWADLAEEYGEI